MIKELYKALQAGDEFAVSVLYTRLLMSGETDESLYEAIKELKHGGVGK